ncbi:MAG: hypothetical protein ACJAUC_001935 [Planctomycetota bacterium]
MRIRAACGLNRVQYAGRDTQGAIRRARYAGRDTQGDSTQGKHTLAKTSR